MTKRMILVVLLFAAAVGLYAADELLVTSGWTYNKGGRQRINVPAATKYDVDGAGIIENVQSITTNVAGEALILGGVTDPGFAWFKNADTNAGFAIQIGTTDGSTISPFLELGPGEATTAWLGVTSVAARATSWTSVWFDLTLDYIISDR